MDCSFARWTRLGAAALAATALACATSEESSFTGAGSSLSAGNSNSASSTGGDTDTDTGSNSDSDSDATTDDSGGSNSDSNSNSGSGSTTDDSGSTTDDATSTTDDTGTTGLDCADGLGNLCGNPYDLGGVDEGEAAMSQTTTIITPGVADWFQVSFLAVNRPGGGTPTIVFAQNDNEAYRFDVYTTMPCGGTPASCGEGGDNGQAKNLLEYSFTDDQPDCCSPPDDSMVSWPGTLYIRVYRVDDGGDCSTYQLQLTR